jgi:hypothetical protein
MEHKQAIEKLNDIRCHVKEMIAEEQALVMAIEALKQPEIVRCRECKHYKSMSSDWGNCYVHGSPTELRRTCQSCDYCSWAERRAE